MEYIKSPEERRIEDVKKKLGDSGFKELQFKTLADYQVEAHKTCLPNCWNEEYLTMGLFSEIGEIADKIKKNIRDNGGVESDAYKAAILKECGDVCWYAAELSKFESIDLRLISICDASVEGCLPAETTVVMLAGSAVKLDDVGTVSEAEEVFSWVSCIAEKFGSSLSEVLEENIKKLQSRKARGVLHGNGDDR